MSTEERSQPERDQNDEASRPGGKKRRIFPTKLRWPLIAVCTVALLVGATMGFLLGKTRSRPSETPVSSKAQAAALWTCSMHPQVKLPEPGLCPICHMPLIPLDNEPAGPRELKMSKEALALAGIRTQPVEKKFVSMLVRLVGKVEYDETRKVDIAARIPGRLDRLFVNYTGITVRKDHHLVELYSPDLIVAQRELLQTYAAYQRLTDDRDRRLVEANLRAAEDKLELLGVLPGQIEEIKREGKPFDRLTIYSPVSGIVIGKHANEGAYVKEGQNIYSIIDLSRVWVYLDAYESDLPWLRYGQKVRFETESDPGEVFEGTVAFIDPVLDQTKRTTGVRVHVERKNDDLRLKPGMFVRATIRSELAVGDRVVEPSLAGKWISPMHPEVIKDAPGKCDVCGMDLVPAEELAAELGLSFDAEAPEAPLVIPATAPLVTGKRAVVYVRVPTSEDLFGQVTAIWKAAEYPLPGQRPTFDRLIELIEEAWTKVERFKRWRDGVAIPPLPDGKKSNFDQLFAAIRDARDKAAKLSGSQATVGNLVEVIDALWKKAGGLSDWERPSFNGREIVLGQRAGDYYLVRGGLEIGEEVVVAGNFKIDSALQIQARPSMMSSEGLAVPDAFRRELSAVYAPYLKLQQALADDRFADALAAWQAIPAAVAGVSSDMLDEDAAKKWQQTRQRIERILDEADVTDVARMRESFEPLAKEMLDMVETFGHAESQKLYKAFCPMAFESKGAFWLQSGSKVFNPYFGHEMPQCGSIKDTFASSVADQAAEAPGKPETPSKEEPR